ATESWTITANLGTGRTGYTATLLQNGKVLVVGGYDSSGNPLSSAELYDPASGTWSSTTNLNFARDFHTATLLLNGQVLAAGGASANSILASAELYPPSTSSPTPIPTAT